MKEKFLCVLAEYDLETEIKLNKLQQKLREAGFVGKQTPNLPNHITLGTYEPSREEELKKKLKSLCSEITEFPISLSSIGLFGLYVLFIAPNVNHELLDLQQYFANNIQDDHQWTAHTTMLIDEPKLIQKAIPILAENFESIVGRITSVSLYEFWPTRLIAKVSLRSEGCDPLEA